MFLTLCGAALAFGGAASTASSSGVPAPDAPSLDAPAFDGPSAEVVGGAPSIAGSWTGTVALIGSDGWPVCTGTLISEDAVLTAAHCVTPEAPSQARIGSVDATAGGELLQVSSTVFHPSYDGWQGADIAIVHLASPATTAPVTIGTDCVADDQLLDGAPVHIVGFGATNAAGTQYPDVLHEAVSTIADADCSQDVLNGAQTTCEPSLRPAGELAAGGGGIDSCYGDSGGPLYTVWQGQTFVVGVTSRGFAGQDCGSGGVYLRPDSWMSWIEQQTGPLPRPVCSGPLPPTPPVDDEVYDDPMPDEVPDDGTDDTDPLDDPAKDEANLDPTALQVATLVMPKNTMGALTLDPTGVLGDVEWTVLDEGLAAAVQVENGTLYYSPRMGFTGQDEVAVEVEIDGAPVRVEVPVVVMSRGCDQTGGAPLTLFGLALLPMLIRRRGR